MLKKTLMAEGPGRGVDVLSFNNRGSEGDTATERFRDCLADIDAAVAFGRRQGYRRFALLGHSTGCQKITYWQQVRKSRAVEALVLAAVGDDYAIARRDLGRLYRRWLKTARRRVAQGRGHKRMPARCLGFSASRFLSVADPAQLEARLFNFGGPMKEFSRIGVPILALFPQRERYACIPVGEMARRLADRTASVRFRAVIVPDTDHGFHGAERAVARRVFDFLRGRRPRPKAH